MLRGITTAASTSPRLTFATACAREATGTGSIWLNSCWAYWLTATRWLPT